MKLVWVLLSIAVGLVSITSAASIDKERDERSAPEMRFFWGLGLDEIGQRIRETLQQWREQVRISLQRVSDFFTNTRDQINETNEKARECYRSFKKDLDASINRDKYENEPAYADFVNGVVNSAANTNNITEFQRNVTQLTPSRPRGSDLIELIRDVQRLVNARVKCTLDAYRDAFNRPRPESTTQRNIDEATTGGDTNNLDEATTAGDTNNLDEATTAAGDNTNAEVASTAGNDVVVEATTAGENNENNLDEATTAAGDNTNAEEASTMGNVVVVDDTTPAV